MSARRKNPRPYLHRGAAHMTEPRKTVLDPPDHRVESPRVRALTPAELQRVIYREGATDPRLRAADRCFERWGATPTDSAGGTRIASIVLIGRSTGGPVPLDEYEAAIVDKVVHASPLWARNFVNMWYRSERTVDEIAGALKMKHRKSVYEERRIVLGYYTGRLHQIGFSISLGPSGA